MKKPRLSTRSVLVAGMLVFLCLSCWLSSAAAASAPAAGAKISFKRVFQGSSPELIEITLRDDSDTATYEIRQLEKNRVALPFGGTASWRAKIFPLPGDLPNFQGHDLHLHRKT